MKKVFVFFNLILVFASCSSDVFTQKNTLVPEVAVNASLNDPSFLSIPGDFRILPNQGYRANGIIVFNIDKQTFLAFDLTCPYLSPNECNLAMDVEDGTGVMSCAICEQSDITFTQFKTKVTINQKTYHLRQYKVSVQGNSLLVTNF